MMDKTSIKYRINLFERILDEYNIYYNTLKANPENHTIKSKLEELKRRIHRYTMFLQNLKSTIMHENVNIEQLLEENRKMLAEIKELIKKGEEI